MPTITASTAAKALSTLRDAAGADGRLSQADVATASKASGATGEVAGQLAQFLHESTIKAGKTVVMMSNPLGNGESSPDRVVDAFLSSLAPVAPSGTAARTPSTTDLTAWMDGLTHFAGADGLLSKTDIDEALDHSPRDREIVAALIDFLGSEAKKAGRSIISLKRPLAEGAVTPTEVRAQFGEYLKTLPPIPRDGDKRTNNGVRETFQFGQWLPFTYWPRYQFGDAGVRVAGEDSYGFTSGWKSVEEAVPWKDVRKQLEPQRQWELNPKNAAAVKAIRERGQQYVYVQALARYANVLDLKPAKDDSADGDSSPTKPLRLAVQGRTLNAIAAARFSLPDVRSAVARVDLPEARLVDRNVYAVELPAARVVDRSVHIFDIPAARDLDSTVRRVDMPSMQVVDSNGNLVDRWISNVDRRFDAVTNGGRFSTSLVDRVSSVSSPDNRLLDTHYDGGGNRFRDGFSYPNRLIGWR